jgi:hypothetical protein
MTKGARGLRQVRPGVFGLAWDSTGGISPARRSYTIARVHSVGDHAGAPPSVGASSRWPSGGRVGKIPRQVRCHGARPLRPVQPKQRVVGGFLAIGDLAAAALGGRVTRAYAGERQRCRKARQQPVHSPLPSGSTAHGEWCRAACVALRRHALPASFESPPTGGMPLRLAQVSAKCAACKPCRWRPREITGRGARFRLSRSVVISHAGWPSRAASLASYYAIRHKFTPRAPVW